MTQVKLATYAAGANPLGVLPFSTALAAMANLKEWWTAGVGHEGSGWRGRKNGNLLIPTSGNVLPVPVSGGPNGAKMITQVAASAQSLISDAGANLLPLDASFSLIQITRPAASAAGNGTIWGNSSASGLWFGQSGADPNQTHIFRGQGTTTVTNAAPGNANSDGFVLRILSYEWISGTSQQTIVRKNNAQVSTRTANDSAFKLTSQRLRMFGTGSSGTEGKWTGDYVDGGIYWGALAAAANAADLAAIEAYVEANYNLW